MQLFFIFCFIKRHKKACKGFTYRYFFMKIFLTRFYFRHIFLVLSRCSTRRHRVSYLPMKGGVSGMACWYVGMGWDKWHVGMLILSYVGMLVWYDQMVCCHVGMGMRSNGMIKWYVVMLGYSVSSCNLIANNLSYLQFDTMPP